MLVNRPDRTGFQSACCGYLPIAIALGYYSQFRFRKEGDYRNRARRLLEEGKMQRVRYPLGMARRYGRHAHEFRKWAEICLAASIICFIGGVVAGLWSVTGSLDAAPAVSGCATAK